MRETEDKKVKPPVPELEKRNFWRGIVAVAVAIFVVASLVLCIHALNAKLFPGNRHFTLRKIEVTSTAGESSRWKGAAAAEELAGIMGLAGNETNIFAADLADLRQRALVICPGIEQMELRRVLPDTIKVRIVERIPRATVWFTNADGKLVELPRVAAEDLLLADFDTTLMAEDDCAKVDPKLLPQITIQMENYYPASPVQVLPGMKIPALQGAMEILRDVQKRRGTLEVKSIVVELKDSKLDAAQIRRYTVQFSCNGIVAMAILPAVRISEKLDRLEDAVSQSVAEGRDARVFDLRFENQVIQR